MASVFFGVKPNNDDGGLIRKFQFPSLEFLAGQNLAHNINKAVNRKQEAIDLVNLFVSDDFIS
jgi:hypothetical protein